MVMAGPVRFVPPSSGLHGHGDDAVFTVGDLDRIPPFLMSVVSDGDRWMFVSSTTALTAGRRDASGALFPYETDDRLHAAAGQVGAVTRMRMVDDAGNEQQWSPFAPGARSDGRRWVSKSVHGDSVTFGEEHPATSLVLTSSWGTTAEHGFVRSGSITNHGSARLNLDLVDGLLGVLPHGIDPTVQQRYRNLTNAYKRAELIGGPARLALMSLEAPVSDLAEPQEVLRATVVWSIGLPGAAVSLDPDARRAFDERAPHPIDPLVTGRPGAYLVRGAFVLDPGESVSWRIVADVGLDHLDVVELQRRLAAPVDEAGIDAASIGPGIDAAGIGPGIEARIDAAVERTRRRLIELMAGADAQQCTGDPVASAHHLANVTYNVMRGGLPLLGHHVDTAELRRFMRSRDRRVVERHRSWFAALPARLERGRLLDLAAATGDAHLERLVRDDLPFSFSRRHGDPSRPWNTFSIRVEDDEGRPIVHFEGNWRDVFQNWEALCESYPEYLTGVVSSFVNASTLDGHNPYRLTRDGIDWECPDPDDPWANIGYWGDHQLIYLLRLLRLTDRVWPGEIARLLTEASFTYAEVPYRIAELDQMLRDPKNTIMFDAEADARLRARMSDIGGDGALLVGPDGMPVLVTLLEKLVVAALAKVSNFVPGGGIWMNTQRPEWNDANNALVGFGLSMVTLFHLRQFLDHLRSLVTTMGTDADAPGEMRVDISAEVAVWLDEVERVLRTTPVDGAAGSPVEPSDDSSIEPFAGPSDGGTAVDARRRVLLEQLGRAASRYRASVASGLSGEQRSVSAAQLVDWCEITIEHLDATIVQARRDDGLVHSYNLLDIDPDGATVGVRHLPEMLEGQVAALGAGLLTAAEQADLLDALSASPLHRADIDTYLLAPALVPPSFLDRNQVPADAAPPGSLLGALLDADEPSVIRRDADGRLRFHADLIDAHALDAALDRLATDERWAELVARDRSQIGTVYETVFAHRAHLGRSGTMYAYEGIGSVYWHMVTKLLLAVQEAAAEAADDCRDAGPGHGPTVDGATLDRLVRAYDRIRSGLGFTRSAEEFGAIPTDPYSHTPAHAGAQQPGMTGAVKEEILTRRRELGVRVVDGDIEFDQLLLRDDELCDRPTTWQLHTADGSTVSVDVPIGSVGLTVCQVPVVVTLGDDGPWVEITTSDGSVVRRDGCSVGHELAREVMRRSGEVTLIRAMLTRRAAAPR